MTETLKQLSKTFDIKNQIDYDFVITGEITSVRLNTIPESLVFTWHSIIYCYEGSITFTINQQRQTAKAPCIITFLPGIKCDFFQSSTDCKFKIFAFSSSFFDDLHIKLKHEEYILLYENNAYYTLKKEEIKKIDLLSSYITIILNEDCDNYCKKKAITYLLLSASFGFGMHKFLRQKTTINRNEEITDKFLTLVKVNCLNIRKTTFYAERLNVSTQHLYKIIKEVTGSTLDSIINDFAVSEINKILFFSNEPITNLSKSLNFKSKDSFVKYFKRKTGKTPQQYRKGLKSTD